MSLLASSAVRFTAVPDGVDAERVGALLSETDAVIAHAEALLAVTAFEGFDVARSGFGQALNGRENVHGDVLGDGADIGLSLVAKDDSLQAAGSFSSSWAWLTCSVVKPSSATTC